MMTWDRMVEVGGKRKKDDRGVIDNDRYQQIKGDEKAQVEVLLGHTVGYGDVKVHVAVRLTCHQSEETIWKGGSLAYEAAKELTESALNDLLPNGTSQ